MENKLSVCGFLTFGGDNNQQQQMYIRGEQKNLERGVVAELVRSRKSRDQGGMTSHFVPQNVKVGSLYNRESICESDLFVKV